MRMQRGKRKRSSALPRAAAGREGARGARVCGSAEPRGGRGRARGSDKAPRGHRRCRAQPGAVPAGGTHAFPARRCLAAARWFGSAPAAGSCRRLRGDFPPPPRPPGRGRAAPAATRSGPASWHGWARHGTAGLGTDSPTDGTAPLPGCYIGRAGREEAAAAAPAPIGLGAAGGRAGAATAPPSPAGVGGPAPLKHSGRAIL